MSFLESKSLTQLRGIAQATEVKFSWDDDKARLLQKIRAKAEAHLDQPAPKLPPVFTPDDEVTQARVTKAVQPYIDMGLRLSFPDAESWEISYNKRRDSGNMAVPLRVIVNCARDMLNG